MSLEEKSAEVEKLFLLLDLKIAQFSDKSKLTCISGCSNCCKSPTVEATILEMLPFAFYLYNENKAEVFYEQLKLNNSKICSLYTPLLFSIQKGGCASYLHRSLICRLFGFSFNKTKDGIPVIVTCKEIKESQSEKIEITNSFSLDELPMINQFHTMLTAIDYTLTIDQYPINKAIKIALEMVMSHFYYRDSESIENKNVS